ncbi:hypothetical protein LTR20_001269 [Exophiala xenobiotica]|nr:hypothetical protein LTR41_009354 [Exophiala xenobiotica]KAK5374977.1 hypothetical protein LTS13_005546 [Exophiala xenobiotica]KAK5397128.1 hypothetical protein LTR79_005765 [Exophiala xenobiotica]KAK5415253.1 hypothetical protein LTR90_006302 [Exophiala xenobiotica]KAK5471007.1 hypothetical protein LTR20_001269 [Exophiala xenobiotica]
MKWNLLPVKNVSFQILWSRCPMRGLAYHCRSRLGPWRRKVSDKTDEGGSKKNPNVTVITTDYSPTSLAHAFTGQDAVLSLLGLSAIGDQQYALIEAAAKAGVKRFLPSEFGIDTASAQVLATVPPFRVRAELIDDIKAKQAAGSPMEWTAVVTGFFLDWGFHVGFLGLDVGKHTAEIWDDGDVPFTVSNLSLVARTVVKLLTDAAAYEASRNAYVYTGSATTTQKELLAATEKATNAKFEVTRVEGQKLIDESTTKLAGGDGAAVLPLVKAVAFARFDGEALTDLRKYGLFNEKFGIKEDSIEAMVKTLIEKWHELPYSRYVAPTVG